MEDEGGILRWGVGGDPPAGELGDGGFVYAEVDFGEGEAERGGGGDDRARGVED